MSRSEASAVVEAMSDGVVGRWFKRPGERVECDEELVEIETDKVTTAYPAPASGYLEIVAAEGSTVAEGQLIARLAIEPASGGEAPGAVAPAALADDDRSDVRGDAPAAAVMPAAADGGPPATPLARQLAERHGLPLDGLAGSGPHSRITRRDVAARLGLAVPTPSSDARVADDVPAPEVHELSRLQQTVARRMTDSHAAIPAFQVETEVQADRLVALREQLRELAGTEPLPSVNDFVVRACALALREAPRVNGSYRDGRFVLHARVSVGVAVAAEDALLVPAIADADRLSLTEIAAESARLAERVRSGAITQPELGQATFTVSNLGMFGMTAITPIIDPPQAAILGVGAIRESVALEGGAVVPLRLMTLRLSCDHRILYGADAARFLARVRELLERPLGLLR